MAAECATVTTVEARLTDVTVEERVTVVEVRPPARVVETREETHVVTLERQTKIVNLDGSPGTPGAPGRSLVAYSFALTRALPAGSSRYLTIEGSTTSSAPLVINKSAVMVGGSIRLEKADPTNAYTLDFLIDGVVEESIPIPIGALKATSTAFSKAVPAGAEIAILLYQSSGSPARSPFRRAAVSLEIEVF